MGGWGKGFQNTVCSLQCYVPEAAPAPAAGAGTTGRVKAAGGGESSKAACTVASLGAAGREQVRPGVRVGGLQGREGDTNCVILVSRWGLLQQLVPAAQSSDAACETLLTWLGPGEQLLAELGQGQLGLKGQERVVQCLQV